MDALRSVAIHSLITMLAALLSWSCRDRTPASSHGTSAPGLSARQSVIVDTDLTFWGDDGNSLLMLLRSASVHVIGVTTTSGNVWTEQATANALSLLERVGCMEVPVHEGLGAVSHAGRLDYYWRIERNRFRPAFAGALGKTRRIAPPQEPPSGWARIGAGKSSGPDFIIEQVLANPGSITLVELGPASNVAAALAKEPRIASLIARVFMSGGALHVGGNTTATAEFNMWFDPESAAAVLASGVPVTLVPLDVTDSLFFEPKTIEGAAGASNRAVAHIVETVRRAAQSRGTPRVRMWDEAVAAVVIDPSIVTLAKLEQVRIDVEAGPAYGATRTSPSATAQKGNVSVVYAIDPGRLDRLVANVLRE
jgi:purine nucleosidase